MLLRITPILLCLAGPTLAQGIDVAIVAAADSNTASCHFADPQAKLLGTGLFDSVDVINVYHTTPSLAQLQNYDAIICWTNVTPADYVAWGDVTADYVDAGGGVVVTVFANSTTTTERRLGGRWVTGGYEVIVSQGGNHSGPATLGAVHDATHPVMAGVTSFDGGTGGYRPLSTALTPGSTLIAEWSDGKVLVAEGASSRRIDLGLFPSSSNCFTGGWVASTNGARLMANALLHTAGTPVTAYCFCDGTGSASPCGNQGAAGNGCENSVSTAGANLTGFGQASASASSMTLFGTNLIPDEPGLYFQANNLVNGGLGSVWNDGLRCAGGGLIRLQLVFTDGSGNSATSIDLAVKGEVSAGDTRRYQMWYRDPVGSPCAAFSNTSNGIEITWGL